MSRTVTAPLERQFGQMAGLDRMSSTSATGVSIVTLQFALDQTLDVAEQQVQAAINAGGSLLPADLPAPPVYAKVNPADAPILTLAVSSETMPLTEVQNLVNTRLAQKISQVGGVGLVSLSGGQRPAVRIQANTNALAVGRHRPGHAAHRDRGGQRQQRQGQLRRPEARLHHQRQRPAGDGGRLQEPDRRLEERRAGAHDRCGARRRRRREHPARRLGRRGSSATPGEQDGKLYPAIILNVQRQPGANVIGTVDAIKKQLPELRGLAARRAEGRGAERPHHRHPRLGAPRAARARAGGGAGGAGDLLLPAQPARHRDRQHRGADLADRHLRR